MRPTRAIYVGTIGLTMMVFATPTLSAPILFTDRSVFNGFVGPHTLVTFETFAVGPLCLPAQPFVSDPCSLSTGGVTFTATQGIFLGSFPFQRPELSIDIGVGAPLSKVLLSNQIPFAPGDFSIAFSGHFLGLDVIGGPVSLFFTEVGGAQTSYTLFAGINPGSFLGVASDIGFSGL